jgi:hypothetical protein
MALAMTDWESHRPLPDEANLCVAFRDAAEQAHGWRLVDSVLSAAELAAREEALLDAAQDMAAHGTKMVKDGLKLKAGMFVHERHLANGIELSLVRDGVVVSRQLRMA